MMNGAVSYCFKERKPCVGWVDKYFKDCLCNLRDDLSFGFGIISLIAWGVAEIPQIITNFRTKSSHGVSIIFLLTWIIGDIFNLLGCFLEPATLPTQLYTALLYTASTVVLVLQSLYYDHLYRWWKHNRNRSIIPVASKLEDLDGDDKDGEDELRRPLNKQSEKEDMGIPIPGSAKRTSARREFYYTSARSLAGSNTEPFRSYLSPRTSATARTRSGPSALMGLNHQNNSDNENENENDKPLPSTTHSHTQPRPIPRYVARGAILAATISLPIRSDALREAYMGFTARRLLQEQEFEHSPLGQWLGWLMAAIYMAGRIPQIVLNIKRGSVEGLNPLMFIFALIANVTYVASILVRSTEWGRIKANMPWLLDAVVCVALDAFIILQYVYYKYIRMDDEKRNCYNSVQAN